VSASTRICGLDLSFDITNAQIMLARYKDKTETLEKDIISIHRPVTRLPIATSRAEKPHPLERKVKDSGTAVYRHSRPLGLVGLKPESGQFGPSGRILTYNPSLTTERSKATDRNLRR